MYVTISNLVASNGVRSLSVVIVPGLGGHLSQKDRNSQDFICYTRTQDIYIHLYLHTLHANVIALR